jgi:hypothetical protein
MPVFLVQSAGKSTNRTPRYSRCPAKYQPYLAGTQCGANWCTAMLGCLQIVPTVVWSSVVPEHTSRSKWGGNTAPFVINLSIRSIWVAVSPTEIQPECLIACLKVLEDRWRKSFVLLGIEPWYLDYPASSPFFISTELSQLALFLNSAENITSVFFQIRMFRKYVKPSVITRRFVTSVSRNAS